MIFPDPGTIAASSSSSIAGGNREAEDVSGNAATILVARLADLLGDTEAGHFDVLLALLAALRATVVAVRGERPDG